GWSSTARLDVGDAAPSERMVARWGGSGSITRLARAWPVAAGLHQGAVTSAFDAAGTDLATPSPASRHPLEARRHIASRWRPLRYRVSGIVRMAGWSLAWASGATSRSRAPVSAAASRQSSSKRASDTWWEHENVKRLPPRSRSRIARRLISL